MVLSEVEFKQKVLGEAKRVSERFTAIICEEESTLDASEILLALCMTVMGFGMVIQDGIKKETPVLLQNLINSVTEINIALGIMLVQERKKGIELEEEINGRKPN